MPLPFMTKNIAKNINGAIDDNPFKFWIQLLGFYVVIFVSFWIIFKIAERIK